MAIRRTAGVASALWEEEASEEAISASFAGVAEELLDASGLADEAEAANNEVKSKKNL